MQSALWNLAPYLRRCRRQSGYRNAPRGGFTLVELLAVVAIIMILMGLVTYAGFALVGNARESRTKGTITKIDKLLQERSEAFNVYFSNTQNLQNQPEYQQAVLEAGSDTNLANLLAKKKLLRRFFPQNFTEFDLHSSMTDSSKHSADSESAEVLYYILSQGTILGDTPIGSDLFTAEEIKDIDGDGLKEFVDGWGKPLRFYRWPTRLLKPDGSTLDTTHFKQLNKVGPASTTDLATDPDDPSAKTTGSGFTGAATFEANYHTPQTFHKMLIVSAGSDTLLGLYEPGDYTNFGYLAKPGATANPDLFDNLSNLNIRAGGK